jgi:hypothetical protein
MTSYVQWGHRVAAKRIFASTITRSLPLSFAIALLIDSAFALFKFFHELLLGQALPLGLLAQGDD